MTGAFAAAAAAASQSPAGPKVNPMPVDTDDPFGDPSDFKGGMFTPTPPFEALVGRSLVMIPRSFDGAARDPFDPSGVKTRKQWTVDLYVIDGGRLEFYHERKIDGSQEKEVVKQEAECSPANPYVVTNMWIAQAAIVSRLTAAADAGKILRCTVTRGARKEDFKAGLSDENVRARYAAWVERGKVGPEVKFTWIAQDLTTDEQKSAVLKWWQLNKDTIKL